LVTLLILILPLKQPPPPNLLLASPKLPSPECGAEWYAFSPVLRTSVYVPSRIETSCPHI